MSPETHTDPSHPSPIEVLGIHALHIKITCTPTETPTLSPMQWSGPEATQTWAQMLVLPADLGQVSFRLSVRLAYSCFSPAALRTRGGWPQSRRLSNVCLPPLASPNAEGGSILNARGRPPGPLRLGFQFALGVLAQTRASGLTPDGLFFSRLPRTPPPPYGRVDTVFKNSYLFAYLRGAGWAEWSRAKSITIFHLWQSN